MQQPITKSIETFLIPVQHSTGQFGKPLQFLFLDFFVIRALIFHGIFVASHFVQLHIVFHLQKSQAHD